MRITSTQRLIPLMVTFLLVAKPAYAIWPFGESEEEKTAKAATHVAELLREPNRTINKAQMAAESGDIESAIKYYRQAISEFNAIEQKENTTGTEFSTMRFKKFHCISMLDALTLKRSQVMDARQTVSDTSELEAILAKERADIKKAEEEKQQALVKPVVQVPQPPTAAELLVEDEKALAAAEKSLQDNEGKLASLQKDLLEANKQFKTLAPQHAKLDGDYFVASRMVKQLNMSKADKEQIKNAQQKADQLKDQLEQAKVQLETVREKIKSLETEIVSTTEANLSLVAKVKDARARVEVRKTLVKEEAEAKRREEEQKRKEAELARKRAEEEARASQAEKLLKKQKEAEEQARLLKIAEEERLRRDAEAKKKAEEEAQLLIIELDICQSLWINKEIDELEKRLLEACERWPNEPTFLIYMARIRLIQDRLDDALEVAQLVPSTGDLGMRARLIAAAVCLRKNRAEEAMKILEQAINDMPNAPEPYFNMAIVMLRLPKFDPDRNIAAEYYKKSVELGGARSLSLERRFNMVEAKDQQ